MFNIMDLVLKVETHSLEGLLCSPKIIMTSIIMKAIIHKC